MNNGSRVLIFEDHPLAASGMEAALAKKGYDCQIAKLPYDENKICAEDYQYAIIDIELGDVKNDGIRVGEHLKMLNKRIKIILISAYFSDNRIQKALEAGFHALIEKRDSSRSLEQAIEYDEDQRTFVSPLIRSRLNEDEDSLDQRMPMRGPGLSRRELQILSFIAKGSRDKEIADTLSISVRTVEAHTASIMRKLRLKNRVQLVHYALREGIITIESS